MDQWTADQLQTMKLGGNGNATAFFRKHGMVHMADTDTKFQSRAAHMYKQQLQKLVRGDPHKQTLTPEAAVRQILLAPPHFFTLCVEL